MHDQNPTSTRRPSAEGRRTRRVAALSVVGAAGLAFAACGGSSGASTTPTTAAPSPGSPSGSSAPRTTLPGASGTIAAVDGTTLEVQNSESGQTAVTYTPTTTIRQISTTTAASVVVGSCISAFGKPTGTSTSSTAAFDEPITATTVSITPATNGTCSRGGFGGGFGGAPGGTPGTGSRPAGGYGGFGGGTSGTGSRPAAGSFRGGSFGAASGQVTAVDGSAVTVSGTDPRTKKATTVTVTLTGTTTFTTTAAATSSAIAVGQCARAVGNASTTGAITATSLTLSTPTDGSCSTGFGFRGGFGGGPGAAGGAPTSA